MSKQASLDKVRDTLVKLKESIDAAEDRYFEAKALRVEANTRLEKAEEEAESYRRRFKLLQVEFDKTKKTLADKQDRLEHVEGRSLDDDEKRREFEGIELERDEEMISIEDEALTAKQQAQEHAHILMESQRKLTVLEADLEKVYQRCEAAEAKEQAFLNLIESNGQELRSLEDRDNDAAEREIEAEEKLRFLEDQLKEAVARAEGAERDVVRNENIVAGVRNDIRSYEEKRTKVDDEVKEIDSLCGDMTSSHHAYKPQDEAETEAEPEPQEED